MTYACSDEDVIPPNRGAGAMSCAEARKNAEAEVESKVFQGTAEPGRVDPVRRVVWALLLVYLSPVLLLLAVMMGLGMVVCGVARLARGGAAAGAMMTVPRAVPPRPHLAALTAWVRSAHR